MGSDPSQSMDKQLTLNIDMDLNVILETMGPISIWQTCTKIYRVVRCVNTNSVFIVGLLALLVN